jgi:flagellar protein FliJ
MASKQTLGQLIKLARTRSDTAGRALGAVQTREREELAKLELLVGYRKEYEARFAAAAREGLDRRRLSDYREFMLRLEEAIHQQQEQLALHRSAVDRCRSDWKSANGKLKSFDTLETRRRDAERLDERRREQRRHDEHAARKRSVKS